MGDLASDVFGHGIYTRFRAPSVAPAVCASVVVRSARAVVERECIYMDPSCCGCMDKLSLLRRIDALLGADMGDGMSTDEINRLEEGIFAIVRPLMMTCGYLPQLSEGYLLNLVRPSRDGEGVRARNAHERENDSAAHVSALLFLAKYLRYRGETAANLFEQAVKDKVDAFFAWALDSFRRRDLSANIARGFRYAIGYQIEIDYRWYMEDEYRRLNH